MLSDNVATVRRLIAGYENADDARVLDTLHPDVEWTQVEEGVAVNGPDAVITSIQRWRETWEVGAEFRVEQLIEEGDQVLAVIYQRATPRSGGPEVDIRIYHLFELSEGRIRRYREYLDRDDAMRAAGLESPGRSRRGRRTARNRPSARAATRARRGRMERHPSVQRYVELITAFNAGDLDGTRRHLTDDFVYRVYGESRTSGTYHGAQATIELLRALKEQTGGTLTLEPEVVLGDHDAVMVYGHATATRGERVLDVHNVYVFRIRDGRFCEGMLIADDQRAYADFWA